MKRVFVVILLLIIALFGSLLTQLNVEPVTFNYYFGAVDISLALLLLLVLGCGALFGLLMTLGMSISAQTEKRRLRHTLRLREQEIRNLREIPIKGRH